MNVTRRTMIGWTAGAVAAAGGVYGLDRAGWLKFFDSDAEEKNPKQVVRKEYSIEKGRMLSILGFGCMRFPILNQDKSKIDEVLTQKMFDYACRHGVNYFDTAYMYMGKNSEPFVGKALEKYPRKSLFIVSKMPGFAPYVKSLADAKRVFQEQLDNCRTKYFDNYLCHALRDMELFKNIYLKEGVLNYLKEEREKGRIRHLGFSFHGGTKDLEYLLKQCDWNCIQLMINCLDWNDKDGANSEIAERLGLPWGGQVQPAGTHYRMATAAGLPIIVMEPLRGGRLVTLNRKASRKLLAMEKDRSIASWGLRFVASLPNVSVTLSGMSRMSDVVDNVRTMAEFKPLTDPERATLMSAVDDFRSQKTLPCTACRYCMPCSYGVDIPGVFRVFNDAAGEGELGGNGDGKGISIELKKKFLIQYNNTLLSQADASHCIACKKCEPTCPQGIKIPDMMQKVEDMVATFRADVKGGQRPPHPPANAEGQAREKKNA